MASQGWLVAIGDWAVMLGLTAIGLSLISGVLSRIADAMRRALGCHNLNTVKFCVGQGSRYWAVAGDLRLFRCRLAMA